MFNYMDTYLILIDSKKGKNRMEAQKSILIFDAS